MSKNPKKPLNSTGSTALSLLSAILDEEERHAFPLLNAGRLIAAGKLETPWNLGGFSFFFGYVGSFLLTWMGRCG